LKAHQRRDSQLKFGGKQDSQLLQATESQLLDAL